MTELAQPRIGVIGLSLQFYRERLPEFVERLQEQFKRFHGEMTPFASVAMTAFCCESDEVADAVRRAEAEQVDALVVVPMSYTASLVSMTPLLRTPLPLVIWNTQEAMRIEPDYSPDDLLMNHVTQGAQDVTNALLRHGRVFGMASGHYRDRAALDELEAWLVAARTARTAQRLRVGLLGAPFQDMGDFGVDTTRMEGEWGPHVVRIPVSEFIHALDHVEDDEAESLMAGDRERYDVADDVTPDMHRISARLECALRRLVENHRLDAFTMNFSELMADGRCPTLPFLGLNKLMGEGLGYAGEGDAMTAALMAQMRHLAGAATFTEIYTVDYEKDHMMMTHMQECNPALARKKGKVRLVRKPFWAPGVEPYVGMHFTLDPQLITLTALSVDQFGDFFYVAHQATIVDMAPLANYDAPHWLVALDMPVGEFLTRYSLAGGPHHLVAVPGHANDTLEKLACLQGFELRVI